MSYPNPADLLVRLPQPLGAGAALRLDIGFVDVPSADISDQLHARLSKAEGMLRVSDWFPILSDGHGLRQPGDSQFTAAADSITLDLRTTRDLDIAAPGQVLLAEPRHHVYRLDHARNFGFVVAPHLTRTTTVTDDGVLVSVYCPPGVDGSVTLATARAALEVYANAYGPYPWPELIVAPTPRRLIADEWPAMVFLGTGRYAHRLTIRHEIAHQWFYAIMGDDQLREPWLDEAFADFSARHFFHHRIGRRTCSRYPVDSSVMTFPDSPLRWGCDSYTETEYLKGSVVVAGVRARLGDAIFFAGLRQMIAEHRFGVVTTVEVLRAWLGASLDRPSMLEYLGRFFSPSTMSAVAGSPGTCPAHEPTPPTHGSCAIRSARCPF